MNSIDKQVKQLGKQTLPPPLEGHQLRFQRKLQKQNKQYGLATMCIGVGQGYAVVIERV